MIVLRVGSRVCLTPDLDDDGLEGRVVSVVPPDIVYVDWGFGPEMEYAENLEVIR